MVTKRNCNAPPVFPRTVCKGLAFSPTLPLQDCHVPKIKREMKTTRQWTKNRNAAGSQGRQGFVSSLVSLSGANLLRSCRSQQWEGQRPPESDSEQEANSAAATCSLEDHCLQS